VFWAMVASLLCAAVPAFVWNCLCLYKLKSYYVPYDSIEDKMDTGDVVLFAGNRILRWAQCSHWSHIGMVWVKTNEDGSKEKFIFEADYGVSKGKAYDGSLMVPLKKKITEYKDGATDVAWRGLAKGTLTPELRAKIDAAVEKYKDVPFDHSLKRGFNAICDCCMCCENDDEALHGDGGKIHAMFCSEILAAIYQDVGLLPIPPFGPPADEYVPRDFSEDPACNIERTLLNNINFDKLHWIERTNMSWCDSADWCKCCICCDEDRGCQRCGDCCYF